MDKSVPGFTKELALPEPCAACGGRGVVQGVFYELDCMECDAVGWLPVAGADLTTQLGRLLTRVMRENRLLRANLPAKDMSQHVYPETGRGGLRGNWTGD